MAIRSPFPGMDPWLELFWEDIHQRALTYAADVLQEQIPGGLRARLQERVYHAVRTSGAVAAGGIAVAEPIFVEVADDPLVEGVIEIVDTRAGRKLVPAIELLSLS